MVVPPSTNRSLFSPAEVAELHGTGCLLGTRLGILLRRKRSYPTTIAELSAAGAAMTIVAEYNSHDGPTALWCPARQFSYTQNLSPIPNHLKQH